MGRGRAGKLKVGVSEISVKQKDLNGRRPTLAKRGLDKAAGPSKNTWEWPLAGAAAGPMACQRFGSI